MKISQSLLGAMDKCPLSLQHTLDTPVWFKRATSGARAAGTGYHAGLQYGYEGRKETGVLPPMDEILDAGVKSFLSELEWDHYTNTAVERVLWDDKVPDAIVGSVLVRAMLAEYFQKGHAWPDDWEIVAIEHPFVLKAKGDLSLSTHGIDLVLRSPDASTLVGDDHKSAGKAWDQNKAKPRKNNQAPMMTWGMRQIWPNEQHYRFCFSVMTYGLKFQRHISDPTPEHELAVITKAEEVSFLYETIHLKAGMDLPANPASNLCNPKWCDFFDGCKHGRVLDT